MMKTKKENGYLAVTLLSVCMALAGCQKDLEDHDSYKIPSWAHGNAYEVLQEKGNYTQFIKGVDLVGYSRVLKGKSIITVVAPDDDAFAAFLSSKGYASVESLYDAEPDFLRKLITYHIMYYAFDEQKMTNFRPNEGDGATEEEVQKNAGYYYKHRTYCQDKTEMHGDTLVYHYERLLPVFSVEMFKAKGIEAQSNYNYFFPNSVWTADNTFNIANAALPQQESVVIDNGYLYYIDQVIEPLPTLYEVLAGNDRYSQFRNLFDLHSTYEQVDDETSEGLGHIAYVHRHGSLPAIACEWPVTDYRRLDKISFEGYNLFAPSNRAMENFFTTYWTPGCGYESLDELDELVMEYFIMQSFSYDKTLGYFIAFPEEIEAGKVLTTYQTPINIDTRKVTDRIMCTNGAFYGMDEMEIPSLFTCVAGPAFKNAANRCHLYMLDASGLIQSLASDGAVFTALVPTNTQYEKSGYRIERTTDGNLFQKYDDGSGSYATVGSKAAQPVINLHTANNVDGLDASESGWQIVESNVAFNYWYVHEGKITCSSLWNRSLQPEYQREVFVPFEEITNNGETWNNGHCYSYDCSEGLFTSEEGDALSYLLASCNDHRYDYYLFSQLLQRAGLIGTSLTGQPSLSSFLLPTTDTRFVAFIPTNEVIRRELINIPGCGRLTVNADNTIQGTVSAADKNKLRSYLCQYFATTTLNTINKYPYPGSGMEGVYFSCGDKQLNIYDTGRTLEINLTDGPVVGLEGRYHGFPFAFTDGCIQFIDGIL